MRALLVLLVCVGTIAAQGLSGRDDTDPSGGRLRVETIVPDEAVRVGQAFRVVVRVAVDRAWLGRGLVQPYVRPLDVPLHLEAGWLAEDPRWMSEEIEPAASPRSRRRVTLALNGSVAMAHEADDIVVEGRRFAAWEIHRRMAAKRPGDAVLRGVVVRFAESRGFRMDFLGNPIAESREDGSLSGDAATVMVIPLPTAGRPSGWSGLIGDYRITEARAESMTEIPGRWVVRVAVEGEGNLGFLPTLRFEPIPEWTTIGILDPGGSSPRRLRLDIERTRASAGTPTLALTSFDPSGAGAWRRLEAPVSPPPGAVRETSSIVLRPADRSTATASEIGWRWVLLAPWIALVVGWRILRARDRDREDPVGARARSAWRRFRRALRRGDDPRIALRGFVAARLRRGEDALVDRGLAADLRAFGLSPEEAAALARDLLGPIDRRYGDDRKDVDSRDPAAWAMRVEEVARRSEEGV